MCTFSRNSEIRLRPYESGLTSSSSFVVDVKASEIVPAGRSRNGLTDLLTRWKLVIMASTTPYAFPVVGIYIGTRLAETMPKGTIAKIVIYGML